MRISDWSSDVCSSDLLPAPARRRGRRGFRRSAAARAAETSLLPSRPAAPRAAALGAAHRTLDPARPAAGDRSEEHTSELQSLMRISYAVFCLKKKNKKKTNTRKHNTTQRHKDC